MNTRDIRPQLEAIRKSTIKDDEKIGRICRKIESAFLSQVSSLYKEGEITLEQAKYKAGYVKWIRSAYREGATNGKHKRKA